MTATAKQSDYIRARDILGADFINPKDISRVYPDLTPDGMKDLPSDDDLRWLKANGYMLVARPHQHLSLLDIRNLDEQLFYSKTGSWYGEQAFAKDERTGDSTRWLAIKKTVVDGSFKKNWADQNKLLSNVETVPSAADFAWAVTVYYKIRGVYLFPGVYARVSSQDSDVDRVLLGFFDAEGLDVYGFQDDIRDSDIGLSASRKF